MAEHSDHERRSQSNCRSVEAGNGKGYHSRCGSLACSGVHPAGLSRRLSYDGLACHLRTREKPLLGFDVETADPEASLDKEPQARRADAALRNSPIVDVTIIFQLVTS